MVYSIFRKVDKSEFDGEKNWIIDKEKKEITMLINSKIFEKEVIFSTMYTVQKYGHVILDFDGEDYFIKIIVTSSEKSFEEIVMEINNSLINFEHYLLQLQHVKDIKEQIFKEVYSQIQKNRNFVKDSEVIKESEEPILDDVEYVDEEIVSNCGCNQEEVTHDANLVEFPVENDVDKLLKPWEDLFKDELKDKIDPLLDNKSDKE